MDPLVVFQCVLQARLFRRKVFLWLFIRGSLLTWFWLLTPKPSRQWSKSYHTVLFFLDKSIITDQELDIQGHKMTHSWGFTYMDVCLGMTNPYSFTRRLAVENHINAFSIGSLGLNGPIWRNALLPYLTDTFIIRTSLHSISCPQTRQSLQSPSVDMPPVCLKDEANAAGLTYTVQELTGCLELVFPSVMHWDLCFASVCASFTRINSM